MMQNEQQFAIQAIVGQTVWQICFSEFLVTLNVGKHRIVFGQSFELTHSVSGVTDRISIPVGRDSVGVGASAGILSQKVTSVVVEFPNEVSIELESMRIRIAAEEPGELLNVWLDGYSSPVTLL